MLAAVLALWALIVAVAGGIRYDLGPIRISSRNPMRPTLVALLLVCLAWRVAYVDWLDDRVRRLAARRGPLELGVVSGAAVFVLVLTAVFGARAGGGSDSFGYLSQSSLWLRGDLHVDQTFAARMPWPLAEESFTPLAYRPGRAGTMVPIYAPGLPLVMAGARVLGVCGPYLVGPVCAAVLVMLTYFVGRKLLSHSAALVSALLTAGSPTLLFMAMSPMADVPAATFWMAALLAAAFHRSLPALASGVLTGVAIAIRPNLAPLALFPALLLTFSGWRARPRFLIGMLFLAGILPFVLLVAAVNWDLYGSAFLSGYGPLGSLFSVNNFTVNVSRYSAWWIQSQGVLCLLFVLCLRSGVLRQWQPILLAAFAVAVCVSYAFYIPFDAWWYLRFLLPAFPIAFLFCAEAMQSLTSKSPSTTAVALLAFFVITVAHTIHFSERQRILEAAEGEHRYLETGVFIGEATPSNAVVLSDLHSGSIRYYSGRLTLRYAWLPPEWLDRAIETLEGNGRAVYVLLEEFEEPAFRERFAGQRSVALLDEDPAAVGRDGKIRLYAVNRAPVNSPLSAIPRRSRFHCRDISPGFWTAGASN